jgi:NifU-like protein involved in Fe-S cluster formation
MSRIYFEDTYIVVIPSYQETEKHKHSMLHVFVGNESLRMDGVSKVPARVKCAVLAWHTLEDALNNQNV